MAKYCFEFRVREKSRIATRELLALVLASTALQGAWGNRTPAAEPVVFGGSAGLDVSTDPDSNGKFRWEAANWTKNGIPGQTATATMGNNNGGRGGLDISIGNGAQVYYDQNKKCPSSSACVVGALGDFKPAMDLNGPGSLTIKEGAVLSMVSKTDMDGMWNQIDINFTLDNGTLRRTHSAPALAGGRIHFGFYHRLLPNQKIDIKVINGGRLENDGKLIFGTPDYFASQGGDGGHYPGIDVAMTINNGTLDLTGGGYPDYPFGVLSGELLFAYEYEEGVGPKNEKYSINFTGPGSITVDPYFDVNAGQYFGGIYVAKQDSTGVYTPLGGGPDFFTPIGYEDLWDLGILQANGQSGLTGATFGTYFTTTGDKFHEDYTLTSLLAPPGVPGDYNKNGKVDAADYVLWRKGGPLQNEVDTPGTVNAADYTEWRARFGDPPGSGAGFAAGSAVPEPASLIWGFAVALAWGNVGRGSRIHLTSPAN